MKNRFFYQKSWWKNMDKVILNYWHQSEANNDYLLHMNEKSRIDRMCPFAKVWRWK